jgi:hypothetical protein
MNIFVLTSIIGLTIAYAVFIAYNAIQKRRMWERLKDGDYVLCVRPDGSSMLEYVMAYRPEEDRVCLSKEGWVSRFEFLCGKNEYYTENHH